MLHVRLVVLGVLTATVLALLVGVGTAGAAPKQSPNAAARAAWARLILDTGGLTAREASRKVERQLLRTARRGQKSWRKSPCGARTLLRRFNRQARRVRRGRRVARREITAGTGRGRLQAASATVDAALLQLPRARRCGGAKASGVREAGATVLESNERTLRMHVSLPPAQFIPHQVGDQQFIELAMEGMGQGGDDGEPGLPAMTKFFGIPEGAHVDIDFSNVQSYTLKNVNLYPTQPAPVDGVRPPTPKPPIDAFLEPPFEIDRKAYASNKPFPDAPADGGAMGAMRDIAVGGVDAAGGQYRPKTQDPRGVHVDGRDRQLRRRQQGHVRDLRPAQPVERGVRRRLQRARELPDDRRPAAADQADPLRGGAADHHLRGAAAGGQHACRPAPRAGLRDLGPRGRGRTRPDRDDARADPGVHPQPAERRAACCTRPT